MKRDFKKKVLSNGMTVLLEKRDLPVVSVAFAVRFGGINEGVEEKGMAHFVEHMLYKGTPTRNTQQIAEEIERNGGELNGFTSELVTAYWCKIPSKHLNVALDVLSDMVINPLFDEKELEKERKVIFEEIKMYKDNPRLHVFEEIQDALYGGTMGMNLAGTFDTLNSITRKNMVEKFKEIYQPNNMILCVVGDADFDELINFCEKTFGDGKGEAPKQEFSLENSTKIEKRKGIDQANMVFAYHVPLAGMQGSYAAQLLSTLMAGGLSSRLFSEIREKRNLAYSVKGDSIISKDFAYSAIYVGAMPENVEKIKKLVIEEYEKVGEGLTEKELNSVKEQVIGNFHISMEDSQIQMANLLMNEFDGEAKEFYEFEKKISGVNLKDVKDLAKKTVKEYSFFALVPNK